MLGHITLAALIANVNAIKLGLPVEEEDIDEMLGADEVVARKTAFFKSIPKYNYQNWTLTQRQVHGSMGDDELMRRIQEIKSHSQEGGMEPNEYFTWMSHVRDQAPQNLLVWGLGYDSLLLDELNAGGKTLFLEPNASWVSNSDAKNLNYASYNQSAFGTRVDTFKDFLTHPHGADLPVLASTPCWDTVLVDSPNGYMDELVGRAVPLYTAKLNLDSCIAKDKKTSTVWVHDCNRALEDQVTKALFGEPNVQVGSKKLRKFMV